MLAGIGGEKPDVRVRGPQVGAHAQAGGRYDDECARGHFVSSHCIFCEHLPPTLHVEISDVCAEANRLSSAAVNNTCTPHGG